MKTAKQALEEINIKKRASFQIDMTRVIDRVISEGGKAAFLETDKYCFELDGFVSKLEELGYKVLYKTRNSSYVQYIEVSCLDD